MENYGIAHFSRNCPKCQQVIHAGSHLAAALPPLSPYSIVSGRRG
ncbi:hypothetical protein ES703_80303 [subsurface metagenome]